jgi:hypothetical protein
VGAGEKKRWAAAAGQTLGCGRIRPKEEKPPFSFSFSNFSKPNFKEFSNPN